jgi:hypothetical protein
MQKQQKINHSVRILIQQRHYRIRIGRINNKIGDKLFAHTNFPQCFFLVSLIGRIKYQWQRIFRRVHGAYQKRAQAYRNSSLNQSKISMRQLVKISNQNTTLPASAITKF